MFNSYFEMSLLSYSQLLIQKDGDKINTRTSIYNKLQYKHQKVNIVIIHNNSINSVHWF